MLQQFLSQCLYERTVPLQEFFDLFIEFLHLFDYLAGHKTPELTMRIYLHYQQEERKKQTFEKVKQMNLALLAAS